MRIRIGSAGKAMRSTPSAPALHAMSTLETRQHVVNAAAPSPTVTGAMQQQRRAGDMAVPAVRDVATDLLAAKMMRSAGVIASLSGVHGWASLQVQVGVGFANINAHMPHGEIRRCPGTSAEFAEARRDLVQRMRAKFDGRPPVFTVTMNAANPGEVRVTVVGV